MSSVAQTKRNKPVPSKKEKYFSCQEHTWLKSLMGSTKYEQMYLIVNKENKVLWHSQLSGYSNVAADRTFWDKLHLLQQIFHFCGSEMLWINITIMEFSFWLPAIHMQQVQYFACIDLASK